MTNTGQSPRGFPPAGVRTLVYSESQPCSYSLSNAWAQPLGRLEPYIHPFTIPPQRYVEASGAHLVSMIGMAKPCRILHETTPFLRLGARKACLLAAKSYLQATETISDAVVPLVDFRGWHQGFFHWFLDVLPRVLVAEQHHQRTGAQVRLLVPERLTAWQSESLARLNSPVVSLLPFKPRARGTNIRCQSLIAAASHRHQHATEAPFAAISPIHSNNWQSDWDRHRMAVPPLACHAGCSSVAGVPSRGESLTNQKSPPIWKVMASAPSSSKS